MSVEIRCGDQAALAGYLYDECEPADRAVIEAHLATCAICAEDLASLRGTRTVLASWAPPDAKLGFRITSDDERNERPGPARHGVLRPFDSARGGPARWWQRPMPAWAQAAAAILIFGVGLMVGTRTAEQASGMSASTAPATVSTQNGAPVSARDLGALERRLRAEMSAIRSTTTSAAPAPASVSDEALMQRVRTLLTQSEERQQRELAVRLTQMLRDVDAQRRMDLLRIEQTFGQMEGLTRPELANQRQMINYLIQRTGAQRIPE